MSKITQVFEDMASGRPIKKPVKTNLLKARKDANEKALKSGFMKMPDYVKKTFEEKEEEYKPHMMYKGDKKVMAKKKEDHDRLNKQGYDHDDPKTKKVEEEKKNCGCGQDPCITYGKGGKMEKMNEAKKKGLDGKECWDGYKQMGTKMKGGKRVDNCVKMKEEIIAEISDDMKMRYIKKANKQITSAEKERLAGKGHAVKTDKDYDRLVSKPLKRRQGVAKARANLGEISDHMKTRYIHKSMRDIDTKERASQLADKQGAPAEVGKSLSKSTGKRRKGIARARANLERPIKESSSWVQQTADTWNDHADNKHPKVQKHIKKAETAYNNKDMEGFHHHTTRAADHAHSLKKESYDRMSWPTHNRHRQRTSARVTADTLNSPTILKKRQEMHPAARKAYDNKVRDNNNKKYGYHPEIGHKQNKTTALPKHLHHPKVGLNDSIQRDVYMSLLELSPKTISSYQKKAGAQYRDLKKSTMSATSREGGYHKGYISDKEYDAQHQMADKKARRGKGLAMSAGKGVKKEEVQQVDELKKSTLASYVKRATGDAISRSHTSQYNIQKGMSARDKGQEKIAKKHFKTSEKESKKTMDRFHGINRAANKLSPGKDKDEYLADTNKTKMGKSEKTFKQMHSGKVKATNESLNKLIGQAVDKIEAASDKVKKKVKIKNASIKNPSTY